LLISHNVPRRAHEFERENIHAPVQPSHVGLFKEAGKPEIRRCVVHCSFQFLPHPFGAWQDTRTISGTDEQDVDNFGIA
jgi:hypothetical protein